MQVLWLSHAVEENCASVWSFSYYSAQDYDASINSEDLNGQPENENFPREFLIL